jgi:rare lipoprotein A
MRTHLIHLGQALLLVKSFCLASCATFEAPPPEKAVTSNPKVVAIQQGIASFYTDRRTASGERFNGKALTAAHRIWPMGTQVRVTNRNNDRGPYVRGRIIDLTPAAAEAIGLTWKMGLARVTLERLE